MGAPTTDEGRLPMPGYPEIGRAPTTAAASSASATASRASATTPASATPARSSSGTSFGADTVANGRVTLLRLLGTATSLEGEARADGFSVIVRGARAAEPAARIAASNPAIARSTILTQGDHAVFDVTFVEGRHPAYRVALQGDHLEVTIGR